MCWFVFSLFFAPPSWVEKKDSSLERAVQIILALTYALIMTLFAVAASYCLPPPPKEATSAMAKDTNKAKSTISNVATE